MMKEIEKLEIIGYVQLYIKLWRVDKPDVAFYFKMDADFTVPIDEETLKSLIIKVAAFCEKENNIEVDAAYITREQYMAEAEGPENEKKFNTVTAKYDEAGPIKITKS